MAGDINLQPLIDQLFGGGAASAPPPGMPSARPDDWQQSLMQSVDPAVQKKERIRNFLSTFGSALSSTPGNLLQGLAAGANKGATVYNQARGEDEQKRIAAQRLIADFTQKQQDRSTDQVRDKITLGRQLNDDQRQDEDRIYNRGRQKKLDELAVRRVNIAEGRAEADARRIDARLPKNNGGPLTQWQQEQTLTALDNLVAKFQTSLGDALNEEELAANQAAVEAYRQKLYTRRGFDPETGAYLRGGEQQAPAPGILPAPQSANEQGKTSLPGKVMTSPPPANQRVVGQTYNSPNGPVIWMGTGWKKVQ